MATRQRFTLQYKLSIVERANACETPGEIDWLLLRERLYGSQLSAWRKAARVELGIRRGTFYGSYRRHKGRGVAGLADRHSGAGVHWNRIPDTVRQRIVDPAREVRTGASSGQRYTVKRYKSKTAKGRGSRRHEKITLEPVNPDFEPIVLTGADEDELQVIAELLEVPGG